MFLVPSDFVVVMSQSLQIWGITSVITVISDRNENYQNKTQVQSLKLSVKPASASLLNIYVSLRYAVA